MEVSNETSDHGSYGYKFVVVTVCLQSLSGTVTGDRHWHMLSRSRACTIISTQYGTTLAETQRSISSVGI